MKQDNALISHRVDHDSLVARVAIIGQQIETRDCDTAQKQHQCRLLEELQQFEFGRYLLLNQGINGFWTHYMLTYPWLGAKSQISSDGSPITALEKFLLEKAPLLLATQQRFEIFLRENQKTVHQGAKLACLPCGMLGELLYLNFDDVEDVELAGIDLDAAAFTDAKQLAKRQGLIDLVSFKQCDAWQLEDQNKYDLISSNGLNIYQPNFELVKKLYQKLYAALKPGGRLVTSFLTPPPMLCEESCEWQFDKIDQEGLLLQKTIFANIIQPKWEQAYCTSVEMEQMLVQIGYQNIDFHYDQAHIMPTVVAFK